MWYQELTSSNMPQHGFPSSLFRTEAPLYSPTLHPPLKRLAILAIAGNGHYWAISLRFNGTNSLFLFMGPLVSYQLSCSLVRSEWGHTCSQTPWGALPPAGGSDLTTQCTMLGIPYRLCPRLWMSPGRGCVVLIFVGVEPTLCDRSPIISHWMNEWLQCLGAICWASMPK